MRAVASLLTGLVALEHVGIMVLEMFFWDHPVGRKIFNMTPEVSAISRVLAANQGLYNGFLAAGLFWSWNWLLWWFLTRFVIGLGHPPSLVEEPEHRLVDEQPQQHQQ